MDRPEYKHAPINSISKLCSALRLEEKELYEVLSLSPDDRYKDPSKPAFKKDGTKRNIKSPCQKLRRVQNKINLAIFKNGIVWPSYLFGSIPKKAANSNRDYIACAEAHCGSKSLCKIDISDFFDNIHIDFVQELFEGLFNFEKCVSEKLAELCCYKGHLVQGALTSSYIAMLILWNIESALVSKLKRKNVRYTRLIDDITISSTKSNYGFDVELKHIENMLLSKDLPVNKDKFEFCYTSIEPLTVHGVRVTFSKPSFSKAEIRNIRAAVHNIEKLSSLPNARCEIWYRKDYNRCMGRVNKLSRVGSHRHKKLVSKLREVHPLPSEKDIKYAKLRIASLKRDCHNKRFSYNYYKRYYKVCDRIKLIGLSFPKSAKELKSELTFLEPGYVKEKRLK